MSEAKQYHDEIKAEIYDHVASLLKAYRPDLARATGNLSPTQYPTPTGNAPGGYTPSAHTHPWSDITGTPTTIAGYGITDAYTKTEVDTLLGGYQPLDSDLTAIAAIATTAYGRGFLPLADAAAARAYIGAGTGSGTVTSVALALPAEFSVSGSPVVGAGTLSGAWATQAANLVFAGPSSGGAATPAFRALVAADIPNLAAVYQPLDADLTAIAALGSTGIAARTAANTWAQRSIVGTANRIGVTNGDGAAGNPTIDIDAAYVGQASITTLGTIATGVWHGTLIGVLYGGTGADLSASGPGFLKQATTGAAVTVAALAAGDLPDPLNAHGIRTALGSNASGLYVPWISGDTHATVQAGSSDGSNNQIAIVALSNTVAAVRGYSVASAGIAGESDSGTALQGTRNTGSTSGASDVLILRKNLTSGTAGAGFGAGFLMQGQSSTTANQDMARLSGFWTDATHASRTSVLAFQTVNNAGAITERMRVTGPGALWIGRTSGGLTGAGDLDVAGNAAIAGTLAVTGAITGPLAYTNLTYSALTTGQVLRATSATAAAFGALDLANSSAVTGVLAAANGGTGINNSTRTLTISTNAGTLDFTAAASTLTIPASGTAALRGTANTFSAAQTIAATLDAQQLTKIHTTSGSTGYGLRFTDGSNDFASFQSLDTGGVSYLFYTTNRQYDGSAWQQLNTRVGGTLQIVGDALSYFTFAASSSTTVRRISIDGAGAVTFDNGPLTIGSSQVLTTRRTGWSAPTGTLSRATFDQSTVTLAQLAQRVAALITDLTTHGLIGA